METVSSILHLVFLILGQNQIKHLSLEVVVPSTYFSVSFFFSVKFSSALDSPPNNKNSLYFFVIFFKFPVLIVLLLHNKDSDIFPIVNKNVWNLLCGSVT